MLELTDTAISMEEAAVELVKKGFAVMPCKPKTKEPKPHNGTRLVLKDENDVRKFWHGHDYNIAIHCGQSGIIVLDFDGNDGMESLRSLEERFGKFPEPTVRTPGKIKDGKFLGHGLHFYFRAPILPEGIEIIGRKGYERGVDIMYGNQYVMAPPSIHPDHPNGERYSWFVQ